MTCVLICNCLEDQRLMIKYRDARMTSTRCATPSQRIGPSRPKQKKIEKKKEIFNLTGNDQWEIRHKSFKLELLLWACETEKRCNREKPNNGEESRWKSTNNMRLLLGIGKLHANGIKVYFKIVSGNPFVKGSVELTSSRAIQINFFRKFFTLQFYSCTHVNAELMHEIKHSARKSL